VSFFICVERFVDPDLGGDRSWFGDQADEAFGMDAIGGIENRLVSKPQESNRVLCRCCGHGALPWGQASSLASSPNVEWYENHSANDPDIPQRVLNRFALLSLNGPNIQETFYDENGGVAWKSP